jgi:peptidoglycan/LPS O-acetylase OafA/YrhL
VRTTLPHLRALDGVRGLAVAAVLAFHGGWLRGGFLGVDAFFVLSGFLITALLLTEHASTGRIGLAPSGRAAPAACCRDCW